MSISPFVHPDFQRLTAVRLSRAADGVVSLIVNDASLENDLVDGEISSTGESLPYIRTLTAKESVRLVVTVDQGSQGFAALIRSDWDSIGCERAVLFALGSFFPLDKTDPATGKPIGRKLRWKPATPKPQSQEIHFTITDAGIITCDNEGTANDFLLKAGTEMHLILLMRGADAGGITLPSGAGKKETVLSL